MGMLLAVLFMMTASSFTHSHSLYGVCPPGWLSMSESLGCVLFHSEACGGNDKGGCSWMEAMEECQSAGSWLVEIKTNEQQDFIVKMAKALEVISGPLNWWIGLTDLGHDGAWRWQHSGSNASVASWGLGEPNGTVAENCVSMSYGSFNYRWSDVGCGARDRTFPICQKFVF